MNQIDLMAENARLKEEVAKLQAFKDWTHDYLDSKGVPHHPAGTHGAEGCRIGDRMDWAWRKMSETFDEIEALRTDMRKLLGDWPSGDKDQQAAAWSKLWQTLEECGIYTFLDSLNSNGCQRACAYVRYLYDQVKTLKIVEKELDRLKSGKLTPEELQNVCHNLTGEDREAFRQGCLDIWCQLGIDPYTHPDS